MTRKPKGSLLKIPTGIQGLDEISEGGFPKGRTILICGSAGCGKTLFGIQFLVKGIEESEEPGVFISFEESKNDLSQNVKSFGIDLEKLIAAKKLRIDHVSVERSQIEETGEYDLEGLFIRLNHAIDTIGAKRVVLDTIESLFSGIKNTAILRAEVRRLFHWLKDKGVTTIITGERGDNTLTRQGLEEYVSDCVILLDFRVIDQIATRRLRIIKYRGSTHGTNEYPFLIDETGVSVLPITSLKLEHKISNDIISFGLPGIDQLFSRKGVFRGSSILVTGNAGTAKTILASYFALSTCERDEKCLYFSYEESPAQLLRNMASIGIKLRPFIDSGLLTIHSARPSLQGLEMHLLLIFRLIEELKPGTVIVDPISSFLSIGSMSEVRDMLIRLIDQLKISQVNAYFTSLTHTHSLITPDPTVDAVSSLSDIWINVRHEQESNDRKRELNIVKSRGVGHITAPQHFSITNKGIQFINDRKQ
jgi:circadian clock protein KaiC